MAKLRRIWGQPSWTLQSSLVEVHLTRMGGHLGPVHFRCGRRKLSPFAVAPWAEEKLAAGSPPILQALRGDFFCLPFGGNAAPFRGECHPVHGETANATWRLESIEPGLLHASLKTRIRAGRVDKFIHLRDGESCIYQRHVVTGMAGQMTVGHHLMLHFASEGRISTSPFRFGQVLPAPFEVPARGGYQSLKPGARFTRLDRVPALVGGLADLSRYPARRGFEDLVMIAADQRRSFAWTAATFPKERYVGFTLKDPRVLRQTVFWHSNGGRHYAPWNGRHVDVLGLEEVTAYFDSGLAKSSGPNVASRLGHATSLKLSPKRPLVVNTIFAVAPIPRGFERVDSITPVAAGDAVLLCGAGGRQVRVPLDLSFLGGQEPLG